MKTILFLLALLNCNLIYSAQEIPLASAISLIKNLEEQSECKRSGTARRRPRVIYEFVSRCSIKVKNFGCEELVAGFPETTTCLLIYKSEEIEIYGQKAIDLNKLLIKETGGQFVQSLNCTYSYSMGRQRMEKCNIEI